MSEKKNPLDDLKDGDIFSPFELNCKVETRSWIRKQHCLSGDEKCLLEVLSDHDYKKGICPSLEGMAEELGRTKRWITVLLNQRLSVDFKGRPPFLKIDHSKGGSKNRSHYFLIFRTVSNRIPLQGTTIPRSIGNDYSPLEGLEQGTNCVENGERFNNKQGTKCTKTGNGRSPDRVDMDDRTYLPSTTNVDEAAKGTVSLRATDVPDNQDPTTKRQTPNIRSSCQ